LQAALEETIILPPVLVLPRFLSLDELTVEMEQTAKRLERARREGGREGGREGVTTDKRKEEKAAVQIDGGGGGKGEGGREEGEEENPLSVEALAALPFLAARRARVKAAITALQEEEGHDGTSLPPSLPPSHPPSLSLQSFIHLHFLPPSLPPSLQPCPGPQAPLSVTPT